MQEVSLNSSINELDIYDICHLIMEEHRLDLIFYLDTIILDKELTQPEILNVIYIYFILLEEKDRRICYNLQYKVEAILSEVMEQYNSAYVREQLTDLEKNDIINVIINKASFYLLKQYNPCLNIDESTYIENFSDDKKNYCIIINKMFHNGLSCFTDGNLYAICAGLSVIDVASIIGHSMATRLYAALAHLIITVPKEPNNNNNNNNKIKSIEDEIDQIKF